MLKKLSLLILFLGVTLAVTGCFGNTPPPEPKGDTLTQEQLNELFPEAVNVFYCVIWGLERGPAPDGLADKINSPSIKQFSGQPFQEKAVSPTNFTWTGPDSGGWYQTTATFGSPGGHTCEDVIKFRHFSNTRLSEYKGEENVLDGSTVIWKNAQSFHGSRGNTGLWSGNHSLTYIDIVNNVSQTLKVNFSNVSDINCSGTFDAWINLTGPNPIADHQYAHYVLVYDPAGAPSPDTPYHLTGWHENPSNTLDQWVAPPPLL
ncbi:MAG: hypothetical protein K6U80_06315 [Firmicutes bacterium]|nr:hypothetical protein [Bacillota bacterium]